MDSVFGNLIASVAATFIPLYAGILFSFLLGKGSKSRIIILTAISSGIIFWFFLDVMNDAVLLDVNQGFAGGWAQVILAGSFAFGLLLLFGLERAFGGSRVQENGGSGVEFSFAVAVIVALGVGFHAFGEGVEIGSLIPAASSMIDAIGGLGAGIAYSLHKFLEGFVVGVFAAGVRAKAGRLTLLGLVAGLPTVLGSVLSILTPINSAYFFALGGSAALYIEYKLTPNLFRGNNTFLLAAAALVGFYSMYIAGLFHG